MKAMLLAAGRGTRLRPLTDHVPKCMLPIEGKPILEYTIEWLRKYNIVELVINLHYLPQAVADYFGDGSPWGVRITYSVEAERLGTAGGVRNVAPFFADETFLIWYGDNLSTCNLERLVAFHRAKGGLATVAVFHREDVTQSGIVGMDPSGRVVRFKEKPRPEDAFSHWVNAGIFVLEPTVLGYIPLIGFSDFGRDVFPALLADDQPVYGYCMSPDESLWWVDSMEDLERTQAGFSMRGAR